MICPTIGVENSRGTLPEFDHNHNLYPRTQEYIPVVLTAYPTKHPLQLLFILYCCINTQYIHTTTITSAPPRSDTLARTYMESVRIFRVQEELNHDIVFTGCIARCIVRTVYWDRKPLQYQHLLIHYTKQ